MNCHLPQANYVRPRICELVTSCGPKWWGPGPCLSIPVINSWRRSEVTSSLWVGEGDFHHLGGLLRTSAWGPAVQKVWVLYEWRHLCLFIEMVNQPGKSSLFPSPGSEWTWDSRLGDIISCQLPGTLWRNTRGPVNTHLWANVSLSFPQASIKCSLHSPRGTWETAAGEFSSL